MQHHSWLVIVVGGESLARVTETWNLSTRNGKTAGSLFRKIENAIGTCIIRHVMFEPVISAYRVDQTVTSRKFGATTNRQTYQSHNRTRRTAHFSRGVKLLAPHLKITHVLDTTKNQGT